MPFLRLFVLSCIVLLVSPPMAAAAEKIPKELAWIYKDPMSFTVVRLSNPRCEPLCPEWISAEGTLVPESAARFRKFLKTIGDRKLPLVIHSPGGSVDAALSIGKLARKRGMTVAVGATRYAGCHPKDKDCKSPDGLYRGMPYSGGVMCHSACPIVLAGGTVRLASKWSYVGVHQTTTHVTKVETRYVQKYRIVNGKKKFYGKKKMVKRNVKEYTTTKMSKSTRKQLVGYFKSMGVDPGIVKLIEATPADSIYDLFAQELRDFKLVTDFGDVLTVADLSVCGGATPAPNCVKR